ncbi:MAG: ParB/RepB/Spo0J family partition protein [Patescibacteria group bacterium]
MSRLGRGLEALISKSFTVKKIQETSLQQLPQTSQGGIVEVELEKIKTNPHQPRKNFDQIKLEELAESIRRHGILQPLLVSKKQDGQYELLVGERRFLAAKTAGLAKIPVIIKDVTSQQKIELALVENIQRHDLNSLEQAQAFKKLAEEFGLTQEEIAKKVGKSRPEVANILRLLTLPAEIQKAISDEKITFGHAKAILGIEDGKKQLEMLSQIINYRLPVSETENQARKIKVRGHIRGGKKSQEIEQLEEQLQQILGTKVNIKKRGQKGQIAIEFYSQEELYNLVNKIAGEEE